MRQGDSNGDRDYFDNKSAHGNHQSDAGWHHARAIMGGCK